LCQKPAIAIVSNLWDEDRPLCKEDYQKYMDPNYRIAAGIKGRLDAPMKIGATRRQGRKRTQIKEATLQAKNIKEKPEKTLPKGVRQMGRANQ
jgi:hypothetical protein